MDATYFNEPNDKGFEERARDFLRDINSGKGFKIIGRDSGHDVRELKVGIESHMGLVFKEGKVWHAEEAGRIYHKLVNYFKERGYEPYSHYLVKPKFIAVGEQTGIIQQYFEEPSLHELLIYLTRRENIEQKAKKLHRELFPEEVKEIRIFVEKDSELRCGGFLKRQTNTEITLEQMIDVNREFTEDVDYLRLDEKPSNLIVLDQRKDKDLERVGLAIIDY